LAVLIIHSVIAARGCDTNKILPQSKREALSSRFSRPRIFCISAAINGSETDNCILISITAK
jgi:hypothetical protein